MHLHFDAVVRVTGSHQILSWDLDFQKFYFPDQITCICWFTWELWSGERNGSCYKKKISFFHEIWLLVCMIFESLGMILALICRETSARKHLRIYCSHEIQWLQFLVSLIYAPRLLIRYIFPDFDKKSYFIRYRVRGKGSEITGWTQKFPKTSINQILLSTRARLCRCRLG